MNKYILKVINYFKDAELFPDPEYSYEDNATFFRFNVKLVIALTVLTISFLFFSIFIDHSSFTLIFSMISNAILFAVISTNILNFVYIKFNFERPKHHSERAHNFATFSYSFLPPTMAIIGLLLPIFIKNIIKY